MTGGLDTLALLLAQMAQSPRDGWPALARRIENAPRMLTAEGGIQAINLSSAARILAPTFLYLNAQSEPDARAIADALSRMLLAEQAAKGGQARPDDRPYYSRER